MYIFIEYERIVLNINSDMVSRITNDIKEL